MNRPPGNRPRATIRTFTIGLAVVGSLIVVLILLTLSNIRTLFDVGRLVRHSGEVVEEIQGAFSALQDVETGQRGYLLTGKPEYLAPYRAAVVNVDRHLRRLEAIVEIPANRARLPQVRKLTEDKLREIQRTIDLYDGGDAAGARRLVDTDVGNRLMEQIRVLFDGINADTRQRLDQRIERFATAAAVAERDLEVGGLLLLLLIALFAILIARHLEARRRYEAQILESHEQLERALSIRDTFLSVAGHEFRTPISALSLTLQNVVRKARRGQALGASDMDAPIRQIDRIARLTETLLDVRRIESGRLTLEPEEMDLAELARDVAARLSHHAVESKAPITVEADQPVVGRWDKLRVEQVLTNLVNNAIKFGRGAPVLLAVRPDGAGAIIEVRDGGIGIDPKDQERIFERFERAASAQSFRGMGLGLWISREVVRAHGGRIAVESAPGQGSLFRVELPSAQRTNLPGLREGQAL